MTFATMLINQVVSQFFGSQEPGARPFAGDSDMSRLIHELIGTSLAYYEAVN
jgi:hypothetical protein